MKKFTFEENIVSRPPFIVSAAEVPEEEHNYPGSPEKMRRDRDLGRAAGLEHIGIHLVHLLPGRRASYPHCEQQLEEFVYVIDGEVDAWRAQRQA
jgi:uncharacterized cupin superfamily protein